MFAIIETGGKQYRVNVGDVLDVARLEVEEGATVELKALMTGEGEKIAVGNEVAAKVTAKVVKQLKGAKVIVYKYKAKKNVRKKQGHRQLYTRIKIESIA